MLEIFCNHWVNIQWLAHQENFLHDLDAWLFQCARPAAGPSLYESAVIIAAEVVWLRFMVQVWREGAITNQIRSQA